MLAPIPELFTYRLLGQARDLILFNDHCLLQLAQFSLQLLNLLFIAPLVLLPLLLDRLTIMLKAISCVLVLLFKGLAMDFILGQTVFQISYFLGQGVARNRFIM